MRKLALTFGFLVALAGQAMAQFPQTLPPSTVVGRLGVSAGPAQAIPFATLQGILVTGGETTVSDANYVVIAADRTIAYTALTAARTVTLLSAAAYLPGTRISLFDRSGNASATKTLSFVPTGLDTINGANATFLAITSPYTQAIAETDGISKWTVLLSGGSFANPTASIGLTAVNGVATTAMRSDAAPALSQAISPTMTGNWIFSPTSGNAIAITQTVSSLAQGLNIAQTGQSSGSISSDFAYNSIFITNDQLSASSAALTTMAFQATMTDGGTNIAGNKYAIRGVLSHNVAGTSSSIGDHVAVGGLALSNVNDGGTNTGAGAKGTLFAGAFGATLTSGATNQKIVSGAEVDVGILTGASARYRLGWSVVDNGNLQAAGFDTAYEVGATSTAPGFINAFLLSNIHGGAPLSTTGCVICTDGSSVTITTGVDLSSYTISGNALKFRNVTLTDLGVLTLGSATGTAATGSIGFKGLTSGTATVTAQAAAGTPTLTLPTASGTFAVSASSPLALSATTGALTFDQTATFSWSGTHTWTIAQTFASATAANWRNLYLAPATTTITGNTGSPITRLAAIEWGLQTLTDSSAVTVTDAASEYIANCPAAAGSVTITNCSALLIGAGMLKNADTTDATAAAANASIRTAGGLAVAKKIFAGTSVTAPLVNATTSTATTGGLQIAGVPTITADATYTYISDPGGANKLFFGTTGGDPTVYMGPSGTYLQANAGRIYVGSGVSIPAGGATTAGVIFSSTTNFGIFYGSSTPTLSAAKGSIYLRSDGTANNRLYINTDGSTGWTAFNTAS